MSAGLKGNVDLGYIKLGAYRFFIAPFDTWFNENSSFNTEDPAFPWKDLGLANEESACRFSVELFEKKAGLPKLRKKSFTIGREAEMDVILEEFSGANLARAIWHQGFAPKKIGTVPAAENAVAVQNVLDTTEYTVQASPSPTATAFGLDTTVGLNVGDIIAAEALSADLPDSVNRSVITDIDRTTDVVTVSPALGSAPASTHKVKRVIGTAVEVATGTDWTVGQYVALALSSGALPTSPYEFRIASIAGDILTLEGVADVTLIGAGTWIGYIMSWKIPFGGSNTVKVAVLACYDDTEGGQYIVFMRRAEIKCDFNLALQANTENMRIPMTIQATKFDDEAGDTTDGLLATLHIFAKRQEP